MGCNHDKVVSLQEDQVIPCPDCEEEIKAPKPKYKIGKKVDWKGNEITVARYKRYDRQARSWICLVAFKDKTMATAREADLLPKKAEEPDEPIVVLE